MNNLKDLIINKFSDIDFNINLFSHFIILYTFLTIFFIIFISKVSSDAINGEIVRIINNFKPQIQQIKEDNNLNDYFQNIDTDKLYSKPDPATDNHNKGLFRMLILSLILLWSGFILFIVFARYSCHIDISFKDLSIENLIVFIFIGFAEYYFFTRIASTYVPVSPSFISQKLTESIKNTIKN